MTAQLAALLTLLGFREASWAQFSLLALLPLSFIPAWISVWKEPSRELSLAWPIWVLASLAALLGGIDTGVGAMALACNLGTCMLIAWPAAFKRNGWRNLLRFRRARSLVVVRPSRIGDGVFATCRFAEGAELTSFAAPRFRFGRHTVPLEGGTSPRTFTRACGLGDFVNHSCDPNAGLRYTDEGVTLVAIRTIVSGDEVSWDYSTALAHVSEQLICECGAANCRGVIGSFSSLPAERQEFFRAHSLVAPALRRRDAVLPVRRAS